MYLEFTLLATAAVFLYKVAQPPPKAVQRKTQRLLQRGRAQAADHKDENQWQVTKKEIRYSGRLYDVTEFVQRHPGGNVIEFYVNNDEDSTEAIQQFHHRVAGKVELIMKSFKSRPDNEGLNTSKVPDRYKGMTEDFKKLFLELNQEGYFQGSWTHVGLRLLELVLLANTGLYLIGLSSGWGSMAGTVVMGLFFGRCAWVMHEGGHYSLTGRPKLDKFLQQLSLGFCLGLSASWWRHQHNKHHAMPQRLKHDVDLNTVPFFAVNAKVFDDRSKANNFFLRNQVYFFAPWGSTLLLINWKINAHVRYAFRNRQYFDLFFMASHYLVFGYQMGFWPYALAYVIASTKMYLNFALSHTHLPVAEEPRHWIEYSLSHTINIQPSLLCDWWMGYLNYQIEHHLFPTMPQYRQREISGRVRALAEKHGLPYVCIPYKEALTRTFKNLRNVSKELTPT